MTHAPTVATSEELYDAFAKCIYEVTKELLVEIKGIQSIGKGKSDVLAGQDPFHGASQQKKLLHCFHALLSDGIDVYQPLFSELHQYSLLLAEHWFQSTESMHRRALCIQLCSNRIFEQLVSFFIDMRVCSQSQLIDVSSFYDCDASVPFPAQATADELCFYFGKLYRLYSRRWDIFRFFQIKVRQYGDFEWGFNRILNANNYQFDDCAVSDVVNYICGLSVIILGNTFTRSEISKVLRRYCREPKQYYDHFDAKRPFLCYFCNKKCNHARQLERHLRSHRTTHSDFQESYICYLMLLKLMGTVHALYAGRQHWNPNPNTVIKEYVSRLQILEPQIDAIMCQRQSICGVMTLDAAVAIMDDVMQYLRQHCDEVDKSSQRAMMASHYIARRLHDYFRTYHCCGASGETYIHALEHVYVVGGALRNVLLDRSVNDVDIVVDTQALQQAQVEHLRKYHEHGGEHCGDYADANSDEKVPSESEFHAGGNGRQCLWYYQWKLAGGSGGDGSVVADSSNGGNAGGADGVYNAQTLARILCNAIKMDRPNRKRPYAVIVDKYGVIKISLYNIIENGVDLRGQTIDICDASDHTCRAQTDATRNDLNEHLQRLPNQPEQQEQEQQHNRCREQWVRKVQRQEVRPRKQVPNLPRGTMDEYVRRGNMHRVSLQTDVAHRDLTINALLLPLQKVLSRHDAVQWRKEDLVDLVHGLEHIEQRVCCVSEHTSAEQIIQVSPIRILRVIKYSLDLNLGISESLQHAIMDNASLLQNVSSQAVRQFLMPMIDLHSFLESMKFYGVDQVVIEIMQRDSDFLKNFIRKTSNCPVEIRNRFAAFKWPTIFSIPISELGRDLQQRRRNDVFYQLKISEWKVRRIEKTRCDFGLWKSVKILDYLLQYM